MVWNMAFKFSRVQEKFWFSRKESKTFYCVIILDSHDELTDGVCMMYSYFTPTSHYSCTLRAYLIVRWSRHVLCEKQTSELIKTTIGNKEITASVLA